MTVHWPPAPPEHLGGCQPWPQPDPGPGAGHAGNGDRGLPDPPGTGLSDPRLIAGVADIIALIGARLGDGASPAAVMPVIRETARRWLEDQVRAGLLPASAGGQLEELARAVHDQRYELGPVTAYLRDPQVENVDVNGCDQLWSNSPTIRCAAQRRSSTSRRGSGSRSDPWCRCIVSHVDQATRDDIAAAAAAHQELGRDYDGAVAEGLIDRIGAEIDKRVDARLGAGSRRSRSPAQIAQSGRHQALWAGIGIGAGITGLAAIMAHATTARVASMVIVVWVVLAIAGLGTTLARKYRITARK